MKIFGDLFLTSIGSGLDLENQEYGTSALAICLSITLVGAVLAIYNTGGPVITLKYNEMQLAI